MSQKIHTFAYKLVVVTLFLLPFHAFASVVFNYGIGLSNIFGTAGVVNAWKELVLVFLTFLLLAKNIFAYFETAKSSRTLFQTVKKLLAWDFFDSMIGAYLLFGIVHFFLVRLGVFGTFHQSLPISQLFLGIKYDALFLYAFLLIKHFQFTEREFGTMLKTVLVSGIFSIFAAYFLYFVVLPKNLTMLGFRNDWSTWNPNQSLAFCQKIEHQDICRMSGTFSGPNQFGAYLVVLFPFFIAWMRNGKSFFEEKKGKIRRFLASKYTATACFFLWGGALILTFSRTALVGTAVAILMLGYFSFGFKKYFWKILMAMMAMILFSGIIIFAFDLKKILVRTDSSSGHFQAAIMGIREMMAHPFGQGLGTSGPASNYFGHPLIPENWYLQVGIELGFIGLMLFIFIVYILANYLVKQQQFLLASSFIAVACMALFLHTFEDASMSLTLFMVMGGFFGKRQ